MTPFGWGFVFGLLAAGVVYRVAVWVCDVRISRLESNRGYRAERRGVLL